MESLKAQIETALSDYVERQTGVRPVFKSSRRAHCATSAFLRADAAETAKRLMQNRSECTILGAPLVASVREENGWILIFCTAAALDALAKTLPPPIEPDETPFLRRLWIWAQHDERQTPDDDVLLQGVYAVLFGAPDAEQTLLSAPHKKDGMARVALEQGLSHIAKLLLWERRNQP